MSKLYASWLRVGAITIFFALSGCQSIDVDPEPSIIAESAPEQVPDPAPPLEPEQTIAIIVTRDAPVYADVANALIEQLRVPYRAYYLDAIDASDVIDEIARGRIRTVVSIGRPAFKVAKQVDRAEVIFAQIFDGASRADRGVAAFPPATMQLTYWKSLFPALSSLGVIASAAFDQAMAEFAEAGALQGIEVHTRLVASDKEALFEFRRLTPSIDGFVLLPDERILSPNVIKRLISHGNANDIQMLVYSDPIYRLGATLRVAPASDDVAAGIVDLLQNTDLSRRELTKFRLLQRGTSDDVEVTEQVAQR